jgi:hypothetical protein
MTSEQRLLTLDAETLWTTSFGCLYRARCLKCPFVIFGPDRIPVPEEGSQAGGAGSTTPRTLSDNRRLGFLNGHGTDIQIRNPGFIELHADTIPIQHHEYQVCASTTPLDQWYMKMLSLTRTESSINLLGKPHEPFCATCQHRNVCLITQCPTRELF